MYVCVCVFGVVYMGRDGNMGLSVLPITKDIRKLLIPL